MGEQRWLFQGNGHRILKALLCRSVCGPRRYQGTRGQVRKPPQKILKKPTVGLELGVPVSVPFAPQELRAQDLSKSPEGKRAIPMARGGGCHPRALPVRPLPHQWLVQTFPQFWDRLCASFVHQDVEQSLSLSFLHKGNKSPGEGAGRGGDVNFGCLAGVTSLRKPVHKHSTG